DRPLWDVHVILYVERPSQKAIIIGRGGSRLKHIGSQARKGIEALLGTPVCLDLHGKVRKDWQRDPQALGRPGCEHTCPDTGLLHVTATPREPAGLAVPFRVLWSL